MIKSLLSYADVQTGQEKLQQTMLETAQSPIHWQTKQASTGVIGQIIDIVDRTLFLPIIHFF